jgi:hypothetical protein
MVSIGRCTAATRSTTPAIFHQFEGLAVDAARWPT